MPGMITEPNEDVLRTVMCAIGEGVLVWRVADGVLVTCNQAASRILGVSRSELEGRSLDHPWQIASEDGSPLPPEARGALRAVRTGQSQPSTVVRITRPDGTHAWVRSQSVVLRDPSDIPYAVVTTFVDITELRETGEQLKETAKHLADAMSGANVGTWELDLDSGHAVRNARWAAILGHAPEEIEPTLAAFTDRVHPDERAECMATMAARFRDGAPFVVECRVKHKDGHWHWVQARGTVAERAADGRASRVAGVLVDVDARKRTEETLRATLAENERLVRELQAALENIRVLEGLLPICMYCKSIRDDAGAWSTVEAYVSCRTKVAFTHGICPVCSAKHFGDA